MPKELRLGKTDARPEGDLFSIEWLNASAAWELQPTIGPVILELMAGLAPEAQAKAKTLNLDEDIPLGVLIEFAITSGGPVVARAFSRFSPPEFLAVTKTLLRNTTMNGKQLFGPDGVFDAAMRGRTLDTWRLVLAAMQMNYPDFFGGLGALAALIKAAPSEPSSTSPATT